MLWQEYNRRFCDPDYWTAHIKQRLHNLSLSASPSFPDLSILSELAYIPRGLEDEIRALLANRKDPGVFALLQGDPHCGKTYFAQQLLVCIASSSCSLSVLFGFRIHLFLFFFQSQLQSAALVLSWRSSNPTSSEDVIRSLLGLPESSSSCDSSSDSTSTSCSICSYICSFFCTSPCSLDPLPLLERALSEMKLELEFRKPLLVIDDFHQRFDLVSFSTDSLLRAVIFVLPFQFLGPQPAREGVQVSRLGHSDVRKGLA
jgi:hypothetical protein